MRPLARPPWGLLLHRTRVRGIHRQLWAVAAHHPGQAGTPRLNPWWHPAQPVHAGRMGAATAGRVWLAGAAAGVAAAWHMRAMRGGRVCAGHASQHELSPACSPAAPPAAGAVMACHSHLPGAGCGAEVQQREDGYSCRTLFPVDLCKKNSPGSLPSRAPGLLLHRAIAQLAVQLGPMHSPHAECCSTLALRRAGGAQAPTFLRPTAQESPAP